MPRNALIQIRRDTAANWTSTNPTLAAGEQGFETNTGKFKIGTGSTAWNSLLYATDGSGIVNHPEVLVIAVSDETTAITTGTSKVTFRMPFAMTLTSVRASLSTASSSGIPTVDIKESGTSIMAVTKLTIDATEKTSTTAATAAVLSDTALADDAEITIDITVAGTGATGLKVYLIGTRT